MKAEVEREIIVFYNDLRSAGFSTLDMHEMGRYISKLANNEFEKEVRDTTARVQPAIVRYRTNGTPAEIEDAYGIVEDYDMRPAIPDDNDEDFNMLERCLNEVNS